MLAAGGGHDHIFIDMEHGAFAQVTKRAAAERVPSRTAAMAIGVEKVRAGKRLRGLFP